MELVLWRHAEAEIGEPDLGRRLTPRGEKQARRVAEWLHTHLPDSTRVYVSPAARAQQTAKAFAELSQRKFRTVDEIAPGASVNDVLTVIDWPNARTPIVVVGHQPTLGQVASFLVTGETADWPVRKAGLWWLSWREREGVAKTLVRAVVSPELV